VILNKDSTVCLEGARPANTFIPPFFLVNAPEQLHSLLTLKIHLLVLKNIKILLNNFLIKKTDKSFKKLTFVRSEFVKHCI
jgi:hypothetical protein